MRVDRRAQALGALLAVGAVPAFLFLADPLGGMLGFALMVTGVFIAVVAAERAVPAPASQAVLQGASETLSRTVDGLDLQGAPVYVHDQGNVGEERLFLPASDKQAPVPILDPDTVAYAGAGGTRIGLALPPAGLALIQQHEALSGTRLVDAGLPEVEAFLKGLGTTDDLMRGVRVTEDDQGLRARFQAAAVEPPCFQAPAEPRCQRSGCALCQAVGCSLARSLKRPIQVASATVEPPWVTIRLHPEPVDQAPGQGPGREG